MFSPLWPSPDHTGLPGLLSTPGTCQPAAPVAPLGSCHCTPTSSDRPGSRVFSPHSPNTTRVSGPHPKGHCPQRQGTVPDTQCAIKTERDSFLPSLHSLTCSFARELNDGYDRNDTDAYSEGPGHALNILGNFLIKSHSKLKMLMMFILQMGN